MRKKKLPIGISDFKKVIEGGYYFVDKSLLIQELIDSDGETILFPRPRRFGKTLNLSMLRYFFEHTTEDTSHLFESLAIWQQEEQYREKQGNHPVIFLTFKEVKCKEWQQCSKDIKDVLGEEYRRHRDILLDQLDPDQQIEYQAIIDQTADLSVYQKSLRKLSAYLTQHYGQKTVILIDEYDTPIQSGYMNGYYRDVIEFMRSFLGGGLKDNSHLEKGVLTGILRIAKESIFSDLNNLDVRSLLSFEYSTYFGLLEPEVEQLLEDYEIQEDAETVKAWYNGYVFGGNTIYNPWSIINYAAKWKDGFRPYWVNTSSNDLIHQVLTASPAAIKKELECLLRGESIRKEIQDHMVFQDIHRNSSMLWNLFLYSGYLKAVSIDQHKRTYAELKIPNLEVEYLFEDIVLRWFESSILDSQYELMLQALVTGDMETFEEIFQEFVMKTFSMFDTTNREPERVYHAFVLGLLVSLQDYEVRSNRESGLGRYDVMLIPDDHTHMGIVIEFKKSRGKETLDQAVTAALEQIEVKQYASELKALGCSNVMKLGIAFAGKKVMMRAVFDHKD